MVKYASFQAFTHSERSLNLSPHAFQLVLIGLMVALLTGCAKDTDDSEEASELALYESAQSGMAAGNYKDAVARLQALEARFPFGRYAEQAQLEIIYAYYQSSQAEAARARAAVQTPKLKPSAGRAPTCRSAASPRVQHSPFPTCDPRCPSQNLTTPGP